jgi:hypothetical protein
VGGPRPVNHYILGWGLRTVSPLFHPLRTFAVSVTCFRMGKRLLGLALFGSTLASCQARSEHARFESALGLPICPTAKIVWHPNIVVESSVLGAHSYGAEAVAERDCLIRLWNDFQKRTGSACTNAKRCVGQIANRRLAIEDRGQSIRVKVLLP